MRIGIFGGSFNPLHKMHKDIAITLIDNNYVDKVIYVPVGNNYKKKDLISFEHRYNMLNLMTKKEDKLEVSNISLSQNFLYTYQVLDYFKNEYNNSSIYFICGSDNLIEFSNWKNYEYILENYKLLVVGRNDDNIDKILENYLPYKNNIIISGIEQNGISSSKIRSNFCENVSFLDSDVVEYIIDKRLY